MTDVDGDEEREKGEETEEDEMGKKKTESLSNANYEFMCSLVQQTQRNALSRLLLLGE
jgi:hypothetical protein